MRTTAIVAGFVSALALPACKGDDVPPLARLAAEAAKKKGDLSPPIPIFSVRDLRASQRYYRDRLGFALEWEHGEPPDFAAISRGQATIFMCQGCQGRGGAWIMTFTRDVDGLHAELARKGALIRRPPTDEPWRLREMHVADLDGNVIRFASATRH